MPVELLLAEEDDNRSSLTYVKPSSLVVVETNQALLEAAQGLDVKLAVQRTDREVSDVDVPVV